MVADFCILRSEGHMMNRRAAITTAMILSSMASVHAQTLDSALAYFPLTLGNKWQFAYYINSVWPSNLLG